jgi:hypothetical protein
MSYDFNDADAQRTFEPIPAGTIVPLQVKLRPGDAGEDGYLRRSKDGASQGLDVELTVLDGPFSQRKLWIRLTLGGNAAGHAEAARISRAKIRAMLESARGIRPDDGSDTANQARRISNYGELNRLRFVGKVGVEPPRNGYPAKNFLLQVITPERQEWHPVEQITKPTEPAATPWFDR